MIAKAKVSIVDPTPGVTRDRVAVVVGLDGPRGQHDPIKQVEVIDTGGFGVYTAEGARYDEVGADLATLTDEVEAQIAAAVADADVILFAVDCQAGITPADEQIARLLREGKLGAAGNEGRRIPGLKRGKTGERAGVGKKGKAGVGERVKIVATKCDGPRWEAHAHELSALGFGEPLLVSAKNNYFRREFLEELYELTPTARAEEGEGRADLKLAIIGKRNAGKSTLVNTLAGEPRMIVSEIAGTTRDAVDVRFEFEGKSLIAIDTAGLRRRRSFQNMVEHWAYDRAVLAVERADVILLLLDATVAVSQVDEHLAQLASKSFKPVAIVVNKWDLVEGTRGADGKPVTVKSYELYLRRELRGLTYAPISFISGADGTNVRETVELAFELHQQASTRVTTGKLNRLVREIVTRQGPSDEVGSHAKVYFVAQTNVLPPTITLVVNKPELFRPNYQRFLLNRFREELPFAEVPIRLVIRARRRREDDMPIIGADDGSARGRPRGKRGLKETAAAGPTASVAPLGEFDESILSDLESEEIAGEGVGGYFDDE